MLEAHAVMEAPLVMAEIAPNADKNQGRTHSAQLSALDLLLLLPPLLERRWVSPPTKAPLPLRPTINYLFLHG
jgi:hypothetical protein